MLARCEVISYTYHLIGIYPFIFDSARLLATNMPGVLINASLTMDHLLLLTSESALINMIFLNFYSNVIVTWLITSIYVSDAPAVDNTISSCLTLKMFS